MRAVERIDNKIGKKVNADLIVEQWLASFQFLEFLILSQGNYSINCNAYLVRPSFSIQQRIIIKITFYFSYFLSLKIKPSILIDF